jgi:hypothetical protein
MGWLLGTAVDAKGDCTVHAEFQRPVIAGLPGFSPSATVAAPTVHPQIAPDTPGFPVDTLFTVKLSRDVFR